MSSRRIALEDVLAACETVGSTREPVTASEVADELDCTRRTALNKLDELADQGDLRSKKVGARSRVWWRPDNSFCSDDEPFRDGFDEMFSRISDGFYALDDEWQFTYVSERAEELINYQSADLVGETIWDVFDEQALTVFREKYRTTMDTQEPVFFEFYDEVLDAWHEVHAYPSETGLSVYFRDITDRRKRKRELEESERRYRALVENFPNGAVALIDEDLHYRTVGGNPHDVANVTVEEIEGNPVRAAIPSPLADELAPRYEAALDGESNSFEAGYDGRVFEFQVVPVRDDDGDVFAALGISWDITERKESQRKLEESEHRYRTLVENFPNGAVGLFDEDLTYTAIGGHLLDHADVRPEDRVGKSIYELYPDGLLEEVKPFFEAALEGETTSFETKYHNLDLSTQTLPVRNADRDVIAGMLVVQNVTDRKEMERELRESEAKFRMLAENLDEVIWMSDPDMREFLYINPAYEEVWGRDRGELYENPMAFLDYIHPEDRERVRDAYNSVSDAGFNIEYRIVRPDDEVRWLYGRGAQVRDDDGEVTRVVGIAEDLTERVERERKLAERNERLESFASMLAHELRNPVTIGQIYSQELSGEQDTEAVEYVGDAFDRIEDMIDVMLVLTRGREAVGDQTTVQLATVAHDMWETVDAPEATLEVEVDQSAQADETYVEHLFQNLFENAVEHGGADVTITVGDLPTGFYVADDGPGIPPTDRDSVFDTGYTTAAEKGGTGLGLAFVQKLAHVYEWEVSVTESASGGARFEFTDVNSCSSRD